ncbi:ABC transporter permease subunit [Metabacillus dongyingensis]|uniref:ABC transporter permease subunit n=1 Tax=Metabacillus dongyingensis TaxID=2874282 RepID=UPI003B8C67A9
MLNIRLKQFVTLLLKIILIILGSCSIAALPSLFFLEKDGFPVEFGFFPVSYLNAIGQITAEILTPFDLTFVSYGDKLELFPFIFNAYFYSISILFFSFLISLASAFLFSAMYLLASAHLRKIARGILMIFESIPDVILILAFQYGVISFFKSTGIKVLQIYGIEDKVYLFPILCLSFVPIALMIRSLINILEEEHAKLYVQFAKAKGVSNLHIFIKHVLRNVFISLHHHISSIYWFMLSSLVAVEFLFQMNGITGFLFGYTEQKVIAIGILLILIPFGLLQWIFKKWYSLLMRGTQYE